MSKQLLWALCVLAFLWVAVVVASYVNERNMTCAEFATRFPNTSVRNVPARCLHFYTTDHE